MFRFSVGVRVGLEFGLGSVRLRAIFMVILSLQS